MMSVVALMMVALVVDVSYITASASSQQAYKTATLLKTLSVSALITGEIGVGKKCLAEYILPNASIIDASNYNELMNAFDSSSQVIISNLENLPNIKKILDVIKSKNIRIIATAKSLYNNEYIDDFFSVKFDIPPIKDRPEDIEPLIQRFTKEASLLFCTDEKFNMKDFKADLSNNAVSLRRQVMISYLLQDIKDTELMDIMHKYLLDKLGSSNDYKKFLHLYEAPLIKAGLSKFKSQLQLSDKLGLNRNTLRKKIQENKGYI
jgi:DNA-binding NtrC family response regulator